ncbi:hypothetical protein MHBO_002599, partial [Bonamia ostreae]
MLLNIRKHSHRHLITIFGNSKFPQKSLFSSQEDLDKKDIPDDPEQDWDTKSGFQQMEEEEELEQSSFLPEVSFRPLTHNKQPMKIPRFQMTDPKNYFRMRFDARRILRAYYGIRFEKELKKIYVKLNRNKRHRRNSHLKMVDILERRFDVFCYRIGYFDSLEDARRGIKKGFLSVDGAVKKKWRYYLRDGDFITLNFSKKFSYLQVQERIKGRIRLGEETDGLGKNGVSPHVGLNHFDFCYTTLSVNFVGSIASLERTIPSGQYFCSEN